MPIGSGIAFLLSLINLQTYQYSPCFSGSPGKTFITSKSVDSFSLFPTVSPMLYLLYFVSERKSKKLLLVIPRQHLRFPLLLYIEITCKTKRLINLFAVPFVFLDVFGKQIGRITGEKKFSFDFRKSVQ